MSASSHLDTPAVVDAITRVAKQKNGDNRTFASKSGAFAPSRHRGFTVDKTGQLTGFKVRHLRAWPNWPRVLIQSILKRLTIDVQCFRLPPTSQAMGQSRFRPWWMAPRVRSRLRLGPLVSRHQGRQGYSEPSKVCLLRGSHNPYRRRLEGFPRVSPS